jgi:autotransporter-associated beta strand protein
MHYPNLIRALGLLAAVSTAPVFAQTTTIWDGDTSTSFNTAGNWSNGVPSATNAAVFDSTSTLNVANIIVQPAIATSGITVSGTGANVGITVGSGTSGATLTVNAGGITLNGERDLTVSRGTTTANTFLLVGATQDWNISPGRTLGIISTGEYDINATGATVTMKGGGAVSVTASNFDIGQTNTNAVTVDGITLSVTAGLRLGQNSAGVGNLTIKSGTVNVGTLNTASVFQFGSGTGASGNLVVEGGSTLSVRKIQSVAGAGASTATFDGANLTATLADAILIDTSLRAFTTSIGDGGLNVNTNNFNVSINAIMGDKSGEVGVFTKSGLGTLTLDAANTFTGATTVSTGTLALGAAGILAGMTYNVASGAEFDVSAKTAFSLAGVNLKLGAGAGTSGFFDAGAADLTLGGNLTIDFSTATPDAAYDLFGFGTQNGDFSNVAITGLVSGSLSLSSTDTWTGTFGGYDWTFSEATGVLSSVSAIPEPSAFAALAGLGALGAASLRRRRRA